MTLTNGVTQMSNEGGDDRGNAGAERPQSRFWRVDIIERYILAIAGGAVSDEHARCRPMLARVLHRVPYPDLFEVCTYRFIMPDPMSVAIVPVSCVQRGAIALGEGLLGLTEEEQISRILPELALAIAWKRPSKLGYREPPDGEPSGPPTGLSGELPPLKADELLLAIGESTFKAAMTTVEVKQAAASLLRSWEDQWAAEHPPASAGSGESS
jgi:hypothetical protein